MPDKQSLNPLSAYPSALAPDVEWHIWYDTCEDSTIPKPLYRVFTNRDDTTLLVVRLDADGTHHEMLMPSWFVKSFSIKSIQHNWS